MTPGVLLRLAPVPPPTDTAGLVAWARGHKLVGLLDAAVSTGELAVPDDVAAEVREALRDEARWLVVLEHTVRVVVPLLESHGVAVRLLKGAASAHLDHPQPWWRTYADVDLLVPPDQLRRATTVLEEWGSTPGAQLLSRTYADRFAKSAQQVTAQQVEIDVHRMLSHEPFGLLVDHDDIFARPGDPVHLGDVTVTALARPERLLHACLHAVLGGHPMAAMPLVDAWLIACSLTAAEIVRVRDLAAAWRVEAVVGAALTEAAGRLGEVVVPPVADWAMGHRAGPWARASVAVFTRPDRRQVWRTLVTLPVIGEQRWPYLREQVWPGQDFLDARGVTRTRWVADSLRSIARRRRTR